MGANTPQHEAFIEANNIDTTTLTPALQAEIQQWESECDAYEEKGDSATASDFEAVMSSSKDLAEKIKAEHEAEPPAPPAPPVVDINEIKISARKEAEAKFGSDFNTISAVLNGDTPVVTGTLKDGTNVTFDVSKNAWQDVVVTPTTPPTPPPAVFRKATPSTPPPTPNEPEEEADWTDEMF